MRFFTGLHSERLSQLQSDLYRILTQQQGAREAVAQIRGFMARFELGSELELIERIEKTKLDLISLEVQKQKLESDRTTSIHPTDELRCRLRELSRSISDLREAVGESEAALSDQAALRSELITSKIKAGRAKQAGSILHGVGYLHCPQCGSDVSGRPTVPEQCQLCGTSSAAPEARSRVDAEVVRRELNERIEQIADSINRRRQAQARSLRQLQKAENDKLRLDLQLQDELGRYDSAFVESIRIVDRDIAMLQERLRSLVQLQEMPRAINQLEEQAGESQGRIDRLRSTIDEERKLLRFGDENARAISEKFKTIMLEVGFPGVASEDVVTLDTRNWKPVVSHADLEWGFWETGSGGKKTLFNVCYALAVHEVARERGMPVPNILIIDSPTKNISDDENPELVESLYREIYRFADNANGLRTQFLLIDSDLVEPEHEIPGFLSRRMAGDIDSPSLISYYSGP